MDWYSELIRKKQLGELYKWIGRKAKIINNSYIFSYPELEKQMIGYDKSKIRSVGEIIHIIDPDPNIAIILDIVHHYKEARTPPVALIEYGEHQILIGIHGLRLL